MLQTTTDLNATITEAKAKISQLLLDNEGYSMTEQKIANALGLDTSLVFVALHRLIKEGNFEIQKSYCMLRSETVPNVENIFSLGGK